MINDFQIWRDSQIRKDRILTAVVFTLLLLISVVCFFLIDFDADESQSHVYQKHRVIEEPNCPSGFRWATSDYCVPLKSSS